MVHRALFDTWSICLAGLVLLLVSAFVHRFIIAGPKRSVGETSSLKHGLLSTRDQPAEPTLDEGREEERQRSGESSAEDESSSTDPPTVRLGLQVLHDNVEPEADIVAVHGLGASPRFAWVWQPKNNPKGDDRDYPSKPLNWLQQLLPAKLSCRVMVFNYNSTWLWNAPQQRLSTISDTLLLDLREHRREEAARNRPLIFIGHSFGGNLIEQAIVTASRVGSEYLPISQSIVGVLFLGTPHRGSEATRWGAIIESLSRKAFVTEKRLLEALEEQSDSLQDRLHDFSRWLFIESVPAVCAFEKLVTDYSSRLKVVPRYLKFSTLVVPESSACIDGHKKIGLDTDHFKINKFYGFKDPSFRAVYSELRAMVETASTTLVRRRSPKEIPTNEANTSEELQKCLQAMRVTNPRYILERIKGQKGQRVGHTCEWILKREEFLQWGSSDKPQFLRLIGSPGIGKTIMSTFLVNIIKEKVVKSHDKTFLYFFCEDKDRDRKTPTAILRSFVWQLLLQRQELFSHVRPDFEKYSPETVYRMFFNDFYALWTVFCCMIRDTAAGEVFILLDALDECEYQVRGDLLRSLRSLCQSAVGDSAGRFKLLITHRPDIDDIEQELEGAGTSLRMDSAAVNDDLSVYIQHQVQELSDRKKLPLRIRDKVRTALEEAAGGTFLWVSLMIAELVRPELPVYSIEAKLKDLPHDLDETYRRILNDIKPEKREAAFFILRCMTAAQRPITTLEYQAAFATWKTNSLVPEDVLEEYADICASCGSLVHTTAEGSDDAATLSFVHQSVKDFLLRQPPPGEEWYHFANDVGHLLLFQICWTYMDLAVALPAESLLLSDDDQPVPRTDQEAAKAHLITSRLRPDKLFPPKVNGMGSLLLVALLSARLNPSASAKPPRFPRLKFLRYSVTEWKGHANSACETSQDRSGLTPYNVPMTQEFCDGWMFEAVRESHEAIVKVLIRRGANLEKGGRDNLAPLAAAIYNKLGGIIQVMLDNGVDIEGRSWGGRTPLMWAGECAALDALGRLSDKGADIHARDDKGRTPLHHACGSRAERATEAVQFLLDKGADVGAGDGKRLTPLHHACEHSAYRVLGMVRTLLDRGADINAQDQGGLTPLHRAARGGETAAAQLLVQRGANIHLQSGAGNTPLHSAAFRPSFKIARPLVRAGASIQARNHKGDTPLHAASWTGDFKIARLILQSKTPPVYVRNNSLKTPFRVALQRQHKKVARYLARRMRMPAATGVSTFWKARARRCDSHLTRFRRRRDQSVRKRRIIWKESRHGRGFACVAGVGRRHARGR